MRKEIIKKSIFQHRFNKKRDCVNNELLCVQRNLVTSLTRKSISKYSKERCNKNATQKQRFWKTLAPFMKNSLDTVIQDIILIEDGNFIHNTDEVCDIFNQYFINILIVNENDNDFQHVSLISVTIVIHIRLHLCSQMLIPIL